jgi:pilus assembly protein CpaB
MRRPTIFLMLAVVAAFLAAVVVFSALRTREAQMQKAMAQTVDIVVASRELSLGDRLDPSDVKLARWARDSVPEGAFTDPAAVLNSYARIELVPGQPILRRNLVGSEKVAGVMPLVIPPGMRAMSVPVDEVSDIAGFVKPHTRVDVVVSISSPGQQVRAFSRIVLQNIEVLAVAQQIDKGKDEPEVAKVVTLLVTPREAEELGLASREGTLRLVMRNYNDDKVVATAGTDLTQLLGPAGTAALAAMPPSAMPGGQMQQGALSPQAIAPPAASRGAAPFSMEIMRDGKRAETVSFVTGRAQRSRDGHMPPHPPALHPPALNDGTLARPAPAVAAAASQAMAAVSPEPTVPIVDEPPPPGGKLGMYVPIPKTVELP